MNRKKILIEKFRKEMKKSNKKKNQIKSKVKFIRKEKKWL